MREPEWAGASTANRANQEKPKQEKPNVPKQEQEALKEEPNFLRPDLLNVGDVLEAKDSAGMHRFEVLGKTPDEEAIIQCIDSKNPYLLNKKGVIQGTIGDGLPFSFKTSKEVVETNPLSRVVRETKDLNPFILEKDNFMTIYDDKGGWVHLAVTSVLKDGRIVLHCIDASDNNNHLVGHQGKAYSYARAGMSFRFGQRGDVQETPVVSKVAITADVPPELLVDSSKIKEAMEMSIDSSADSDRFDSVLKQIILKNLTSLHKKINELIMDTTAKIQSAKEGRRDLINLRVGYDNKLNRIDVELRARKEVISWEPKNSFPEKQVSEEEIERINSEREKKKIVFENRAMQFTKFWQELRLKENISDITEHEVRNMQAVFLGVKPAFFSTAFKNDKGDMQNAVIRNEALLKKFGLESSISQDWLQFSYGRARGFVVYNRKMVGNIFRRYPKYFPRFKCDADIDRIIQSIADSPQTKDNVRRGLILGFPLGACLNFESGDAVQGINHKKDINIPGIRYDSHGEFLTPEDAQIIEKYHEAFYLSGIEKFPLD